MSIKVDAEERFLHDLPRCDFFEKHPDGGTDIKAG